MRKEKRKKKRKRKKKERKGKEKKRVGGLPENTYMVWHGMKSGVVEPTGAWFEGISIIF